MDVSSCRRLEPTYAFKPSSSSSSSSSPNPYSSSFNAKPSLLCRPPHLPLTKLPKLTILSDNEARACSSSNSHDHHSILDTSSLGNKLHGTLNAPPPNHLINRTIKTVNGHGSANGATTNNTISSSCVSTVEEAAATTTFQASSSSQQAAWAALLQDADISNYMKIMQALYLRDHPPPSEGLGIVEFLKGKNLFITGATGFLAKVLVEKILRVQPDVGQLFLLIKGKDVHHATKRLQDEIIHSQLFNNLKSCYGDSYQQFMERKITPIVGNIASSNLGMDAHTAEALQRKLDIIINSAASTTFDERYDHALNLNTRGAQRIVEFGRSCMHLQLLMHVSTAFVNGERKGVVKEKTFKIGYSIANEALKSNQDLAPDINVEMESRVIQKRINDILNEDQNLKSVQIPQLNDQQREKKLQEAMKELGMERAKRFGWQDTYVFTKAMGEMLVDSTRGQLPVVIIRPSVVESSFKDPFPGWMEGNRMMDPIIISYGKGQLPGFLVDPKSVLDVVPVDMVANAMLAAMAKHASKPGLEVYQVASSVVNPLLFSNLAEMSREHFLEHPFKDNVGKPLKIHDLQLFQDMDSFMNAVTSCSQSIKEKIPSTLNAEIMLKRHTQLTLKVRQQAAYLANLYRPYTFYAGRFDNSKTQQLYSSLSQQEKETFGFDVSEVDWETYIKTIHIPGLRKHVLKGRGSNM